MVCIALRMGYPEYAIMAVLYVGNPTVVKFLHVSFLAIICSCLMFYKGTGIIKPALRHQRPFHQESSGR